MIGKVRKLSMTLNLNTPGEYEGGNLKFDFGPHNNVKNQFHECVEIRPRGSVIVFPSYVYHQVKPVKDNVGRYCIAGNVAHDFDASTMVNVWHIGTFFHIMVVWKMG